MFQIIDKFILFRDQFILELSLPSGLYEYIFKINQQQHLYDVAKPKIKNSYGGFNNILFVWKI